MPVSDSAIRTRRASSKLPSTYWVSAPKSRAWANFWMLSAGAGDDFRALAAGLRDGDGHAEVFEGAGGVPTEMLEPEMMGAGVIGGLLAGEQRAIAFGEGDDGAGRAIGEVLAKAPDAARIEGRVGSAPYALGFLQLFGRKGPGVGNGLQQIAASGATIPAIIARDFRGTARFATTQD